MWSQNPIQIYKTPRASFLQSKEFLAQQWPRYWPVCNPFDFLNFTTTNSETCCGGAGLGNTYTYTFMVHTEREKERPRNVYRGWWQANRHGTYRRLCHSVRGRIFGGGWRWATLTSHWKPGVLGLLISYISTYVRPPILIVVHSCVVHSRNKMEELPTTTDLFLPIFGKFIRFKPVIGVAGFPLLFLLLSPCSTQ